VPGLSWG